MVDIGCGSGNIFATLKKDSSALIDVASGSLKVAGKLGYIPVLADALNLPFISGFADIVRLNATLHHCDKMEGALKKQPGWKSLSDHAL